MDEDAPSFCINLKCMHLASKAVINAHRLGEIEMNRFGFNAVKSSL
jgi:hypothetical protein